MAYYVSLDCAEIADDLYRDFGHQGTVSGTGAPAEGENGGQQDDATLYDI